MEFNTPTTKTEMYTILNDIFYYYRIYFQSMQWTLLIIYELFIFIMYICFLEKGAI